MIEPRTEAETTVRYTYRILPLDGGVYAECLEVEAAGEGRTQAEAVESLREALEEKLGGTEAIAPPPVEREHHIVLVEATPQAVGSPVA